MTKRLQIPIEDVEYREIQRVARLRGISISEWVRQAIAFARRQESSISVAQKLNAVCAAVQHSFPTADVDVMLAEIEAGQRGSRS